MPRFPGVALEEVEPARVRGEPAVGRRRAEVELGAEAVQRRAGPRDPLRVGVRGEEPRLLGVRAPRADDDEADAVALAPRRPSGRTRARRRAASACPAASRTVPAYSPAPGAPRPIAAVSGTSSASAVAVTPRRAVTRQLGPSRDADADQDRRERVCVREVDDRARRAVARGRLGGGPPADRLVGGAAQPARSELEDTRIRLAHRPGAGERREVRRALLVGARRHGARVDPQEQPADDDGEQDADEQDGRLAALGRHRSRRRSQRATCATASPRVPTGRATRRWPTATTPRQPCDPAQPRRAGSARPARHSPRRRSTS